MDTFPAIPAARAHTPAVMTPLKFSRLSRRLSERRFCALTGVPRYLLRACEAGEVRLRERLSAERVAAIASILGVPVETLVSEQRLIVHEPALTVLATIDKAGRVLDALDEDRHDAEQHPSECFPEGNDGECRADRDSHLVLAGIIRGAVSRAVAEAFAGLDERAIQQLLSRHAAPAK